MDPHHLGAGWAQASKGTACYGDRSPGAVVASQSLMQPCILLADICVPSSAFSISSENNISFYAHVYSLSTSHLGSSLSVVLIHSLLNLIKFDPLEKAL